ILPDHTNRIRNTTSDISTAQENSSSNEHLSMESINQKTGWLEEVKDLWQAIKKTTNQELQNNINTQIKEATQKRMDQYSEND
ncbi:992_t:CDS:2, partial [Acaulospora morrowiae]